MLLGDYFHFLKTCTVKDKMMLSQDILGAHPSFSGAFGIWKDTCVSLKSLNFHWKPGAQKSFSKLKTEHFTLFYFISPLIILTLPKAVSTSGWIKGGLHIRKSTRNEHNHSKNTILITFDIKGLRGAGNEELIFSGYRVSLWDDENFLDVDGGDWCRTLNVLNQNG